MPPNTIGSARINEAVHHENDNEVMSMEIVRKRQKRWNEFETKIVWFNLLAAIILHCVSLYTFIVFPYLQQPFLVAWTMLWVQLGWLALSVGAHRFWSHQSFKAKLPLRIILVALYYSCGMYSIRSWVRDHRVHHKYVDTDADPYNSTRGFWFSHIGWLLMKKKPIVYQRGKGIDISDIEQDPVIRLFDRNHYFWRILLTAIVPVVIPVYFFNQDLKWSIMSVIFMRYPLVLNLTFSLNSFAHMYGYRPYDKSICPADNIWVSIICGGEGCHNYHHVFPWDYRTSELKNVLFNTTTLWIDFFAKIGWAYDLKRTRLDFVRKIIESRGDGTHVMQRKQKEKINYQQ